MRATLDLERNTERLRWHIDGRGRYSVSVFGKVLVGRTGKQRYFGSRDAALKAGEKYIAILRQTAGLVGGDCG